MIPSPFHGIFSSFGNDDEQGVGVLKNAKNTQEKRMPPAPEERAAPRQTAKPGVGQVALDIFEFDNYYIIKAPIAGVKMTDLDIEINDTVLTIRGARRQTDTIPESQYYLKECFWGEFERSVTLPCSIDPKKVKATFNKESILKIIVPKEERVKIIRIND
jgi:HSP20 family protein